MKPKSFNYGDYLQLQAENEHLQFRVKQTEYSATEMLNAACEIVVENETLRMENISLRAERDALLKSVLNPNVTERGD
jgi:regulator of replication initiation timing